MIGLRVPGSFIDANLQPTLVGSRFMRGSGTSQATAAISGLAALLLEAYPTASPDAIRLAIRLSASRLGSTENEHYYGAGLVDGGASYDALAFATSLSPKLISLMLPAGQSVTGTGTIEGSRGTSHVIAGGVALTGERDIFGTPFDSAQWAEDAAAGTSWSGSKWRGNDWTGSKWSSSIYASAAWEATTWSAKMWTGSKWSAAAWADALWDGSKWSGSKWRAAGWSGSKWSGSRWSSDEW